MKTKKRFLGILLGLALMLGLMPGMSLTAYAYAIIDIDSSDQSGSGWTYTASNHTLTLTNYEYNGNGGHTSTGGDPTVIFYKPTNDEFHIVLNGNNKITVSSDNGTVWGIYSKSNFTISGDGTIEILTADGNKRGAAIYSEKNLTIEGSCTVNAKSGSVTGNLQGYGIGGGNGTLTIGKDARVTLTGPKGGTNMKITNAAVGIGWTNTEGTDGKAMIDVAGSQDISSYQKVQFPAKTATVTFKVENGSWNEGEGDTATSDKVEVVFGTESDALKLTADQIPAVGSKPNDTYKAGSWDVTPSADTAITAATTYTYTYAAKEAAVVTKAPEAKTLTYTGSAQSLVTAGSTEGGEMQYALGTETEVTQPYTTSIPTGTEAGTYYVWYRVAGDDNHTDTQPAAIEVTISEVPVFSVQVTNDGNGTASANPVSGATGTEVTLTAEAKEGYRFREWQVISGGVTVTDNRFRIGNANAEIRAVFEEIPVEPVQPVTYATVSAVGAMHTIGSGENAVITVERSTGDKRELELFTGAAVDGILVPDGSYSAAKGSLILTLKSAYLDTLREGEHKVTISFRDGSAEAALTIKPAMKPAVTALPMTGDGAKPVLWLGMIAAGLAMAIAARSVKKRRDR